MIKWNIKLILAKKFSHIAHDFIGQKRKYSLLPYHVHTDEVAEIVSGYTDDEDIIIAAFYHDLGEDFFPKLVSDKRWIALWIFQFFYGLFPKRARQMVTELTDVYTSEDYPVKQNPLWNRKWRKMQEAHRISQISDEAKTIKLADFFSNTKSIVEEDADFAITYLKEKHHIMKGLRSGNRELYGRVSKQLKESIDKLNVVI